MKFNKALIGLAAMLALAGAQASTVATAPGGNLGINPDNASFYGAGGGATNPYTLTLQSTPTPGFNTTWDLTGFFTGIFGAVDVSGISLTGPSGTQSITPLFTDSTFSFSGLTDGVYTLKFSTQFNAAATGILYGDITATAVTTPVPEPESLALMLAGLGVAGMLLQRRKSV